MQLLYSAFSYIMSLSVTASFTVLFLLVIRLFLDRVPKQVTYFIWLILAVRLLCPVSISSHVSLYNLIPMYQTQESSILTQKETAAAPALTKSPASSDTSTKSSGQNAASSRPEQLPVTIGQHTIFVPVVVSYVWLGGMCLLFSYLLWSYWSLKRRLAFATRYKKSQCYSVPIVECENIRGPFVFGFLSPVIVLPYRLDDTAVKDILRHEMYHVKHYDYVTKLLAFVLLAIHWMNPLLLLSYSCFTKDMEYRCDEGCLKHRTKEERNQYARTLLAFAGNRRSLLLTPASFGEKGGKRRMKRILREHRISAVAACFAVLVVVISGFVCLTNAGNKSTIITKSNAPDTAITADDLYELRHDYVGDASKNTALLDALFNYYNLSGTYTLQLQTDHAPYGITIRYDAEKEQEIPVSKNQLTKEELAKFKITAACLALTDNLSYVTWSSTKTTGTDHELTYQLDAMDTFLNADKNQLHLNNLKTYGKDKSSFEDLMQKLEQLNNVSRKDLYQITDANGTVTEMQEPATTEQTTQEELTDSEIKELMKNGSNVTVTDEAVEQ